MLPPEALATSFERMAVCQCVLTSDDSPGSGRHQNITGLLSIVRVNIAIGVAHSIDATYISLEYTNY